MEAPKYVFFSITQSFPLVQLQIFLHHQHI